MNLVIDGIEYPLSDSITHAKLADLIAVATETKKRGSEVSLKTLREYVTKHMMLAEDALQFVDGYDRVLAFLSVVYLCRRHAGEDVTFADGEDVRIDSLQLSVTVEDDATAEGEANPKAPTDSAPADDGGATTS